MSEEDLANKETYISDFDITKHIVLDNESNYWYSAEYVDKMLKKQDKEIERLNNIIEKNKYSADELNEIERLHSIIKEVREYIEELNDYGIGKQAKKRTFKNIR